MLAASLQIVARGYSQEISISLKNAPLEKLFTAVEQQTNFRFVYSKEAMELSKPVTIEVKNEALENILKLGFSNQPLSYSIDEKFIIVKIAEKKKEVVALFHDVNGRVVNENREAVVATITEKGTTNAVSTDINGYFQLKDIDENSILIVTGVGIETMEVKVAGKSNLSISVKTKITGLTEVIINKGYYSTSQKLNTGNVSKITAEIISKQPISNPLQALQGRVPGLQITQNTGVPGGGFTVKIRGQNSLRPDANNPLYIVDGVPFTSTTLISNPGSTIIPGGNPLNNINPEDIESIEILKDADATAIYGSRGANGIILITTKKGKPGKTNVDVNFYAGIAKVPHMMDLLNTQEWLEMRHEAYNNDGRTPTGFVARDLLQWDTTRYTDWQKVLIGKTAQTTYAKASISGGNSINQFLIGLSYRRETTVFPGDFTDQKISGHFNLNHISENRKFKASFLVSYVEDNNNLLRQDLTGLAISLQPNAPAIYDQNGNLNWEKSTWSNPFAELSRKYKNNTGNLIANGNLNYQIIPSLQLKAVLGYNTLQGDEIATNPIKYSDPALGVNTGSANYANVSIKSWIIEPQAEYQIKKANSRLSALVGVTFQQNTQQGEAIFATGFANDALLENIQAAPTVSIQSSNYTQYRYNAFFGRLNFDFYEKYLINFTGRRDGSSRFGPSKQFASFGAIGAAWIFSNEKFVQKSLTFLSYGKLRVSYGITGNDQVGDYGYLDTYSTTAYPYQGGTGLYPTRLVNPDYAWEANKKFEGALELGFLKDRLLFTASYYRNRSSNQLVGYPLANITGFPSIQNNFPATVQNTGVELELNTNIFKDKNFLWSTSINLTMPDNKLISYPNIAGSPYANTYKVGEPLYIKYLYHYEGVNTQTGVYQFQDLNGDNILSTSGDRQFLKKIEQNFYGGFQNNFQYKGFQLDIFFQFVKQTGLTYLASFLNLPGRINNNQPSIVMNRWRKPGDATDIQKFSFFTGPAVTAYSNSFNYGDNTIGDASFIRLKNISVSYQLPLRINEKLNIKNSRIYLLGQNLFTITNYIGLDPESQYDQVLPPLRIFTAGIQLTF